MSLIEEVRKFVSESFNGKIKHFERTLHWTKKLKPDADEALQIAALSHDISRSLHSIEYLKREVPKAKHDGNDPYYLKHQEEGAEKMEDFLKKLGAEEELIKKVSFLIRNHERGGSLEADILKDADSISYLENNAKRHIKNPEKLGGKEKLREKIEFMFNRISTEKAKEIARPMYKELIREF